ncbi:MAG: acyltransferase [Alphaproteobacteria bacterium]|nr:acyltransferase [Alphaproteobacteria bacterium]
MNAARLYLANKLISLLPPSRAFGVKRALLRFAGATIGNNVRIVSSAEFYCSGALTIGDNSWIGHQCLIAGGRADIVIGKNVNIAPRVTLVTGSHKIDFEGPMAAGEGYSSPVTIGDGAWLGAACTILGGTTVGEKAVIAAGAVAKGDVPAKTVFKGL